MGGNPNENGILRNSIRINKNCPMSLLRNAYTGMNGWESELIRLTCAQRLYTK